MLKIIEIQFQTPIYNAMVGLRYRVLRKPLGLQFTKEQLEAEKNETHLAVMLQETLIGCVLLAAQDKLTVKLRQMAIESDFQGQGVGKSLLKYAESVALQKGFQKIILHARENAVGFYQQSGYRVVGQPFIEVTLPHARMEKLLR